MLKLGTGHYFTQQSRWALLQIYGQLNKFGEFLKLKEAYLSLAGDEDKKKQAVAQLQTTYFN